MNTQPIYLDYAAATPLDPEILQAMQPYLSDLFYNPSSSYLAGRKVAKAINEARADVAQCLGAKSAEIIFTAGATEANNLAIHGVMQQYPGANLLIASTEHEAILAPASRYVHELLPVDQRGILDVLLLKNLIDERTVLISVSLANNEIGTIQPIKEIVEVVHQVRQARRLAGNELPLFVHTDAAQAGAYLDLHVARLGIDLMTLNGGKIYGPKQTGILYVHSDVSLLPLVYGGKQERGLRSGTENVPGIIGFTSALQKAQATRHVASTQQAALRDTLLVKLQAFYPNLVVNGSLKKRLPGNLNVSFPGLDGERLLMMADEQGLMLATGAACSANKETTGSHVLKALGKDEATIDGSIRLTLGQYTTEEEVLQAAKILHHIVSEMTGEEAV